MISDAEFARLGSLVRQLQGLVPAAHGTFNATWAGSSTTVDTSIPHGLGRAPTVAFAQVQDSGVSGDQNAEILAMDDTSIAVRITTTGTTPTTGTHSPIGWQAW